MQFNYYPGCTLSTKAKELDLYARQAADVLGFPWWNWKIGSAAVLSTL